LWGNDIYVDVVQGYDPQDLFDEAFEAPGEPRDPYAGVLDRLKERDLGRTVGEVRRRLGDEGCEFGDEPFRIDLVPRVLTAEEWEPLARGLEQRVRALDAFIADAYGEKRIVAEGVLPERVLAGAEHYEPELADVPAPRLRIALAGFDVIRYPDGSFPALEANLRTPSGLAYVFAAREVVAPLVANGTRPEPVEGPAVELLGRALRAAASCGHENPRIVLLTDGPDNTAYWEHERLAERLGIELATLDELRVEGVDVVYRRTDDDTLRGPDGSLTRVGGALLGALKAGTLACVNALGNGVADDKLVHAYVEEMIRFYLGEEPLLPSVPTYDLAVPECREEALDRMDELVFKPRSGLGGRGVVIGPHAQPECLHRLADEIEAFPESWIAQETVMLSTHPTIAGDRLEPRHVDLRPFIFLAGEDAHVLPGGLTRFAIRRGALVVNSSHEGGAKDTWVLR